MIIRHSERGTAAEESLEILRLTSLNAHSLRMTGETK